MKQKTKQAASKRFHRTATGKLTRRAISQAHFNSRDTGKQTRDKRHARSTDHSDLPRIAELLPNS